MGLKFFKILILLLPLMASTSCRYFRAETTLVIQALNEDGEGLANAKILVNKELIGETDAQGYYKSHMELPIDESILVEVSKPSKDVYYAPYFETIKVKRGDLNSFKLTATLFSTKPLESKTETIEPAHKLEEPSAESPKEELTPTVSALESAEPIADSIEDTKSSKAELTTQKLLTFYLVSGRESIEGATVYLGHLGQKQWTQGCTSNSTGRCSFSIDATRETATVLVRAKGYQTQVKSFPLVDGDKIRLELARGKSLEIFTLNPNQGEMQGVEGIEVYVDEKLVGNTDRFGSLIVPFSNEKTKTVRLSSKDWLPSEVHFTRDEVNSEAIIQHYQSVRPLAPRLAVMNFLSTKTSTESSLFTAPNLETLIQALNKFGGNVRNGADLAGKLSEQKLDLDELNSTSFHQMRKISEALNYIIRPSFIDGDSARVILSAIDLRGQMSYSTSLSVKDKGATAAVISELSKRLLQNISHEGTIIDSDKGLFRINMGRKHGLTPGDKVQITGNIRLSNGEISAWDKIASAQIAELSEDGASIKILETQPNSKVEPGNSVRLERKESIKDGITLDIRESETQGPIALAEIYKGDEWLGTSDLNGKVLLAEKDLIKAKDIQIFAPGYLPKKLELKPESKTLSVQLNHLPSLVQIETSPAGATVKLNGRDLGRTPIDTEIPYPGSTVNIEVGGMNGFELLTKSVSVGARGIIFRNSTALTLKRDALQGAKALAKEGKASEAISLLESITEDEPNYLLGLHLSGELYLNSIKDPIKAASTFHRLTTHPKVEGFQDKRFIGSFINEAIALYQAGENSINSDANLAISYWRQAEALLNKAEPELRNVPEAQLTQAAHTVKFYRALSSHKCWVATQSNEDYKSAQNYWKSYLDDTANTLNPTDHLSWVKRAETYYRDMQTAKRTVTKESKSPVAL